MTEKGIKRLTDGSDPELGLLYYLFSAHHWPLSELRALWEGETAWHDVVLALASYEANKNTPPGTRSKKTAVPVAKK